MIKYFFCDVDGTLTDSQGLVSKENVYWINQLEKHGITFVVSSGRPVKALESIYKALNKHVCSSCLVGAYFIDENGEKVVDLPINSKAVRAIYQVSKETDNNGLTIFADNRMISVLPISEYLTKTYGITQMPESGPMSEWFVGMETVSDIEEIVKCKVYKMEFHYNTPELALIALEKLKQIEGINPILAADKNIEIVADNASKGKMIEYIRDKYHLSFDQIAAIGDSGNDLAMLQACKYSIAMGNALQDIKDICFKTVADNDHNGVAEAIKWIIDENL